jgi:hypothetical protein
VSIDVAKVSKFITISPFFFIILGSFYFNFLKKNFFSTALPTKIPIKKKNRKQKTNILFCNFCQQNFYLSKAFHIIFGLFSTSGWHV